MINNGSTFRVQFMYHRFPETFPDSSVLHRKGETHPPMSHLYNYTHRLLCSHLTAEKIKVWRSDQPRITQLSHLSFFHEPMVPLYIDYSYWSTSLGNHATLFLHFCRIRPKKTYMPQAQKFQNWQTEQSWLTFTSRLPQQGDSQAARGDCDVSEPSIPLLGKTGRLLSAILQKNCVITNPTMTPSLSSKGS